MTLQSKSLTDLRGIAQSFGVADIFTKDKNALVQAIELKQQGIAPAPRSENPLPAYDARLMTKSPSRKANVQEAEALLKPFTDRGLKVRYDDNGEYWYMSFSKKTDEGTMRQPLRQLWNCAEAVMK